VADSKNADDWMIRPYRWRWFYRYPYAIAILAASAYLCVVGIEAGNPEWMIYATTGCLALYGASIAWEAVLTIIGLALAAALISWASDWESSTWAVIGVGLLCWFIGRSIDQTEARLNAKIEALQRQINSLRDRPFS
jgi:type IV secretory pathway TrbD component